MKEWVLFILAFNGSGSDMEMFTVTFNFRSECEYALKVITTGSRYVEEGYCFAKSSN